MGIGSKRIIGGRAAARRGLAGAWRLGALLLIAALCSSALARSGGIVGVSGNPDTSGGAICSVCHSGGTAPTVVLDGPTSVAPGSVHTYSLTILGGQQIAGGFNVSSDAGLLGVADPGTMSDSGELTHTEPRPVNGSGEVVFVFNWTAPSTTGQATIYGAGGSVDLNGNFLGDAAERDALPISVSETATPTPGESSGGGIPLLVTGFDPQDGTVAISYDPACEATSHNIYFGPLAEVSAYAWMDEVCEIGLSGAFGPFDPGSGDVFFVVVGVDDVNEGSYGRASPAVERPPFSTNACGQQQSLADTCDAL